MRNRLTTLHTRLRQATLGLSILLGLSALPLAGLAAASSAWFVLGTESILLVAAVIGLLFARGRFPQAPPMTLALLAGTVGLCGGLAYLSTGGAGYQVGPLPMKLVVASRLALAALFAAGAVAAALGANPGAWGRVALGAALVATPTGLLGLAFSDVGASMLDRIVALGPAVAVALAAAAFLLWVGLVSAGGHMIITTFERALPAPWEQSGNSHNPATGATGVAPER